MSLDHKRKPITKRYRIAGDYPYYGATGVLGHVEGYLFDEKLVLVGEDGAKWGSGEDTAFAVEGKIWVNNHAHVLRPHRTRVLDKWLIYFLNHSDLSELVSGLTVPKLNQGNLREIPIPLAPLPEQQQIVGILDEAFEGIATAKANAEKNLQNARALFESGFNSAITGRLTDDWRRAHPNTESASVHLEKILTQRRSQWKGTGKYKEPDFPFTNKPLDIPNSWTLASPEQISTHIVDCPHIAQAAFRWVPSSTQLQGRRLKARDGTSARLADTPGNQQAFPQPPSQNPGAGFPVMKIVASFCVA